MTGFLASVFGLSLTKDSMVARRTISGSNSGRERLRLLGINDVLSVMRDGGGDANAAMLAPEKEMLNEGAERKGGEEGQCAHDENGADQQPDKERTVGRKRSGCGGQLLLGGEAAGGCKQGNEKQEAAEEHSQAEREVVPGSVSGETGEGAAIVAGGADNRVKDFSKAMRTGIGEVGDSRTRRVEVTVLGKRNHRADRCENQDAGGGSDQSQHGHF